MDSPDSRFARACAALALAFALALPAAAAVALPAAHPEGAPSAPAAALRQKFEAVRPRLDASPYGQPLWLDSRELDRQLEGDAYAVVAHPFSRLQAALSPIGNWCEVLLLPFNTKHCEASSFGDAPVLSLFVGRKNETPLANTYRLDFRYALQSRTPDHFRLQLTSGSGPLGTRDYRIVLEATPLDAGRTFLHLSYSYEYGTISKLAMQTYLATLGAHKVGFSSEGRQPDGRPRLVRGMRGVMERNTMRYFLAIDAYLASLSAPPPARVRKRLDDWFAATERYPLQLHEIERHEYLAMKLREFARMLAGCCREAASS